MACRRWGPDGAARGCSQYPQRVDQGQFLVAQHARASLPWMAKFARLCPKARKLAHEALFWVFEQRIQVQAFTNRGFGLAQHRAQLAGDGRFVRRTPYHAAYIARIFLEDFICYRIIKHARHPSSWDRLIFTKYSAFLQTPPRAVFSHNPNCPNGARAECGGRLQAHPAAVWLLLMMDSITRIFPIDPAAKWGDGVSLITRGKTGRPGWCNGRKPTAPLRRSPSCAPRPCKGGRWEG